MPVPKRYFHVSQEINHDPEMWRMREQFGDRTLGTWLEILVYLDKGQNRWRMVDGWLASLSRTVRQSSATVSRIVGQCLANGWLEIVEASADGSPLVVRAPNYRKYYRTPEHGGNLKNKSVFPSYPIPSPSLSPPLPSPTPKKKKKERVTLSMPENWALSEDMKAYAFSKGMTAATAAHEFEKCKHRHSEATFTEIGWKSKTWQTWVLNWITYGAKQVPNMPVLFITSCAYANEHCEEKAEPGSKYCKKHKEIISKRQAQR